ncbi:MAG: aspartate aminotransferase family protein, partial [Actinobacteria bacterium]|nr:aspartate aminotransferase family protein [Actinomycetota bacterium]
QRLATAVQQVAVEHNLLLLTCGALGNVVRIIPPLTVTSEEIATGLDRLRAALKAAHDG